jgi:hypothetical protein
MNPVVQADQTLNQSAEPMEVSYAKTPAQPIIVNQPQQWRRQQADETIRDQSTVYHSDASNTESPLRSPAKRQAPIKADLSMEADEDLDFQDAETEQQNQSQNLLDSSVRSENLMEDDEARDVEDIDMQGDQSQHEEDMEQVGLNQSTEEMDQQLSQSSGLGDYSSIFQPDLFNTPVKNQQSVESIEQDEVTPEKSPDRTLEWDDTFMTPISPSILPPPPPEKWPKTKSQKRPEPPSPDIPSMSGNRDRHLVLTPKRTDKRPSPRKAEESEIFDGTTFIDFDQQNQPTDFRALNLNTQRPMPEPTSDYAITPRRTLSEGGKPQLPSDFERNLKQIRKKQKPVTSTPHKSPTAAKSPAPAQAAQAQQVQTMNTPEAHKHQQLKQKENPTKTDKQTEVRRSSRVVRKPDRLGF